MTEWKREDIDAFLRVMDPQDDQTGGGTASAVAGAMAAGLAGMVARLSVGREGMEPELYYREIDSEARALTVDLLEGGRRDSEAFAAVMRAYRLPRDTEEAKAARSREIQDAMLGATKAPLANAEYCCGVLRLVRRLEGRSNANAASDLEVGRRLAVAGLQGCIANVDINVGSIRDEAAARALRERADALRACLEGEDAYRG